MKLINYKRGYNNTFDCSIHGTIKMTRDEFDSMVKYLYQNAGTIKKEQEYFSPELLKEDLARRVYEKTKAGIVKSFLVNIRVSATQAVVNHFNIKGYKRGNYQIQVEDLIQDRLEELRHEIDKERISYGELAELVSLRRFIAKDDMQLLQWAGVPEKV